MMEPAEPLEKESQALAVESIGLAIRSAEDYAAAGEQLKRIAAFIRRVGVVLDPIVDAAYKAHKVAVATRESLLRPAEGAKRVLGERLAAWDAEQARARRALEAAAREERARLDREAWQQREAEDNRRRAEAEARRLDEAAALEAAGDREGAARLIEAPPPYDPVPPPAPAVFVPPPPEPAPRIDGISYRDVWTFEIVDSARIPPEFWMVDEKKIGAVVRAMRSACNIPGIKVVVNRIAAVRE